uniref:Putative secreted peptide n=1 Tax=Anopheles braziliensis TaxID=58242 RepID=A0A2M3ZR15_9DIPT
MMLYRLVLGIVLNLFFSHYSSIRTATTPSNNSIEFNSNGFVIALCRIFVVEEFQLFDDHGLLMGRWFHFELF